MKKYRKIIAMMLAAALTILAAGCAGKNAGTSSDASKTSQSESSSQPAASTQSGEQEKDTQEPDTPKEVKRITMYPFNTSVESGIRGGYLGDLLAERGVELEIWAYSPEKTSAIMASGDLPDLMHVGVDDLNTLIEEGMVLNLEDYLDQMPHVKAIEGVDAALNYMREFQSAGTGGLYALPKFIGTAANDGTTERFALKIFWDYYEEMGTPQFSSLDDLIPILKEIQEKHPTDPMGNKVYALGTYYDPDFMNYLYGYAALFGYDNPAFGGRMCVVNLLDEKVEYLLDEDGIFKEALIWYNKLYREGLFDPNSVNMDRPTHQSIVNSNRKNGTYILALPDSPSWEPYYLQLYFDDEKIVFDDNRCAYGNTEYIAVNANTENLDACLAMMDILADPDAYLVWRYGPEGELWEEEDGVARLTEGYKKSIIEGTPFTLSSGEELRFLNLNTIMHNGELTSYVDEDGNALPPMLNCWPEYRELVTGLYPQMIAWKESTGYENWTSLLQDKGALTRDSRLWFVSNFAQVPDDAQKLTISSLMNTVNTAAWKMIYAETQEEFDSLWDQMIKDAEGQGAKEMYEWTVADIENAAKIIESLN